MQTEHVVHVADAREAVAALSTDAVDLVVTSPPYPMVEMWDESFTAQDPAIGEALAAEAGSRAFELMHDLLDDVWADLPRVVRPGGIVVVNVGPATRTLGEFQQYPNHEAITRRLRGHGFQSLPGVLWRKPTNSAAKFMGSGMLPTNAYPTLEHEHLLVFRNGGTRSFPPGDDRRYESAYFWEERNEWFSDLWEFAGERQALDGDAAARERSGAFPLDLPLRLVRMFSVYGDTVLDPFWGTGTTSLAALVSGRSSVGIERDPDLVRAFDERVADAPALSTDLAQERLDRHREFVAERRADGDEPSYDAEHYDFPVVTKQERRLRLYETTAVTREDASADRRRYVASHDPV
ncbi:DNA-methyltransferase [Haloglomus litoreum]|uniref:DNA-methyltransferase n=1 Tax=Haloglomus litoreum TaxID=3034026 RepID=UPI0023E8B734|nr:site-specific DNA-methyltransferase [Haloglomus sp. DT116]